MRKLLFLLPILLAAYMAAAQAPSVRLKKKDRKKDVELVTTQGTIVLRLYDSTPLHRDNFLKLVKAHVFDSVLFHRVIKNFMIQGGDPQSKRAPSGQPLGEGDLGYTVPAEFRPSLFHKKGALAAARTGDDVNPEKRSSASQFYIVQGKTFSNGALDTLETTRLKGYHIPPAQREVYRTLGGTPHLDQNYTVFGEVVRGLEVVDAIAATPTSKAQDRDRPLTDIRVLKARLVKRKRA